MRALKSLFLVQTRHRLRVSTSGPVAFLLFRVWFGTGLGESFKSALR
jgi:hypothetical protein